MIYVIVNPLAGKGNAKNAMRELTYALNTHIIEHRVSLTEYRGHAERLAYELSRRADCELIVAIGGDGTFNEVVSGMDLSTPIALVPAGTGNDFAYGVGLEKDPRKVADKIAEGSFKKFDVIKLNSRRCLNVAGTGFDVDVLLNERKIRRVMDGKNTYLLSLFVSLLGLKFTTISLTVDHGFERVMPIFLIAAANGNYYGGGLPICPGASSTDGKIDLVVVKKFPRILLPYILVKFFTKRLHTVKKYVEIIKCESVNFSAHNKLPINIDGELINDSKAELNIMPEAMTVVF